MRFNLRLLIVLILSLAGEFIFLLAAIRFTDKYYIPFLQPFGWIFGLGLLQFLIPLAVSREKAFEWFQYKYVWGSVVLFIMHLVILVVITQITINL
ncbi:MAG: hypothetical protein ACTHLB_11875 [Parafilimonas sp.]